MSRAPSAPRRAFTTRRRVATVGVALVAATSLAACAQSQREAGGGEGGTLTFGAAGAPDGFDPFYASDGETFRISRQIMEGLVGFKPGSADVEPELAESWEHSPDGKAWTFKLRTGVKFHDGTDFNAEAVCKNFQRMFDQTGAGQNQALSYYWIENFGGFSDGKTPSLYQSCESPDPTTAVVHLTRASSKFPDILGLPSFSMQSPTAMEKYKANDVQAQGDSFVYPEYSRSQPTGTGPFKFASYDEGNGTIKLVRNEEYWGEKTKLNELIFRIIPDETVRKQELESGAIDGYDFPNAADLKALRDAGHNVQVRDPFNIMYLGITQKNNPALKDVKVRQALAYALDRETLVKANLPEGASVATQFYPDTVDGYADDVQKYPHDPAKAKQLLAEAGVPNLTVNFYWPTEVTRPYMPDPQGIYNALAENLRAAGITVNPVSKPWNGGYIDDVDNARADIFLLGWTGDYNTPDNFIGTFFGTTENRFYTAGSPWGADLADQLKAADAEPDEAKREQMYQDINRKLMSEYLPAIPLSHSPPAIVTSAEVEGLQTSPLTAEEFASVSISGQ
ncbi:peptide/nickel transport system substrate-binding protein [Saccharopolyspora antimicrobica]|uniref:Peptide/nickel transport system substrate-binding protein n=1 Tax=Saccharopolyspora antimicrobica TaxID=455193 RepID=A0A1I5IQU9_9PSEU|nr:ABC transporter substrate-binding protein [Saccharopolyspora antimicrobica]RKT84124.1 peptide/nickel transport system substrate-binding protein [Saccharopolyspora antimicrobica]SFO62945.1 peptide/nickel transport system substrate-binding protein [Saccharopolyspora antimicrobica]